MLSAVPENFWERVTDKVAKMIFDRETGAPRRVVPFPTKAEQQAYEETVSSLLDSGENRAG